MFKIIKKKIFKSEKVERKRNTKRTILIRVKKSSENMFFLFIFYFISRHKVKTEERDLLAHICGSNKCVSQAKELNCLVFFTLLLKNDSFHSLSCVDVMWFFLKLFLLYLAYSLHFIWIIYGFSYICFAFIQFFMFFLMLNWIFFKMRIKDGKLHVIFLLSHDTISLEFMIFWHYYNKHFF